MCGRYALHSRDRITFLGFNSAEIPLERRYNIAPSQNVLAIADFGKGLEARMLAWGLIPSWSTDGKGFINAGAETLEERPSFSESFRLRRCLMPADGFFEWKRTGREKRPFYIQSQRDAPVMFAGIWDSWRNHGETVISCAIITTPANELVRELHGRMPAILLPEFEDAWLNPKTNRVELLRMLSPFPSSEMKMHPVSNAVNSPENDTADVLVQVDTEIGHTLSLF